MSEYNIKEQEELWREMWKEWELYRFDFDSDKPVYSIDNPPRYASGALHLGHATGYTLIDFAARYHRMKGDNVFFPLCFDVNGTPIEVKVEKEKGITKLDVDRHEFIEMCREFANRQIGEMIHQFEILGESMDPSIYYQTDAEYYRRITQITFLKMLEKGLVYKGEFPINWCPRCMTALADAEVEYAHNITKLNYIRFIIEGEEEFATIATTRPELLPSCQIVAVHPDDEKNRHLIGKTLITPIFGKKVKVIADEGVDPDYGTGIVMICTIGDKDDLEWVHKYNLPIEMSIDQEGRMLDIAGKYAGMTIKEARAAIIEDLKKEGLLIKQEDNEQNVGLCWRCKTPIEFLQVPQWFLKTTEFKEEIKRIGEEINWFPEFMKVRLNEWTDSLSWDWVISRQRYFATPIPVWHCKECGHIVPAREEDCYVDPTLDKPPVERCPVCGGELEGCPDVFDTWMDSSISPLYNTFYLRDEERFKKLYPMTLRPQGHDIIRTWAFYTILREYLLTGEKPWENIMIHGFIMAPDGTPMHASAGNVIDPLPIIDEYGGDAMRYYASTCSLGTDHAFRIEEVKHATRFMQKFWNMQGLISNGIKKRPERPEKLRIVDRWILSRFNRLVEGITENMENYQFDRGMKDLEMFSWHVVADHYLEMVKHRIYSGDDRALEYTLYTIGLGMTKLLAPFMPYLAEAVYQEHYVDKEGIKSIHISSWPEPEEPDPEAEELGDLVKEIISEIRSWKASKKMPLGAELKTVEIIGERAEYLLGNEEDIAATIKAREIVLKKREQTDERITGAKPIYSRIGPKFRQYAKHVTKFIAESSPEELYETLKHGPIRIELPDGESEELTDEEVEFEKTLVSHGMDVDSISMKGIVILIEK